MPLESCDPLPMKWSAVKFKKRRIRLGTKRHKPEEFVTKLQPVEVLFGQGLARVDRIRKVRITEQTCYRCDCACPPVWPLRLSADHSVAERGNSAGSRAQNPDRKVEKTLRRQATKQCFGASPACAGNHRSDGSKAGNTLTIKLDHSGGVDHTGSHGSSKPTATFWTFLFNAGEVPERQSDF